MLDDGLCDGRPVLAVDDATEAVRDALFVLEEIRQYHAVGWATPGKGTARLGAFDRAVGRLLTSHAHARHRCERLAGVAAEVWAQLDAEVRRTLATVPSDRLVLVLQEACSEAHRWMDMVARTTEAAEHAHAIAATHRVLALLRESAPLSMAVRPDVQVHVDAVLTRWTSLEAGMARDQGRRPRHSAPTARCARAPSAARASPVALPRRPSCPSLRPWSQSLVPVPALGVRTSASCTDLRRPVQGYVPDADDALAIGVARECDKRRLPIRHLDGHADDEYHRYVLRSKLVVCRLLAMVCRISYPAPPIHAVRC